MRAIKVYVFLKLINKSQPFLSYCPVNFAFFSEVNQSNLDIQLINNNLVESFVKIFLDFISANKIFISRF
jgi:hypothetical protein